MKKKKFGKFVTPLLAPQKKSIRIFTLISFAFLNLSSKHPYNQTTHVKY